MPWMTQRQRDQLNDIAMARRKKEGRTAEDEARRAAVAAVTARLAEGLDPRPQVDSEFLWKHFQKTLSRSKSHLAAQVNAYNKALLAAQVNACTKAFVVDSSTTS